MTRSHRARALVVVVALAAAALLAALGAAVGSRTPAPTTTTSTSITEVPTTTTTESATTTTERPVPTTPRPTSPATTPTEPPPTTARPSATTTPPSSVPCGRALVGISAVGLPAGFEIFCSASKAQGHAGLVYWSTGGGSFVAINPSTGNYEGVGAHEACHAQQFVAQGSSTEAEADACAAAAGWPNPYAEANDTVIDRPGEAVLRWLEILLVASIIVLVVATISLLPTFRRHLRRKDYQ